MISTPLIENVILCFVKHPPCPKISCRETKIYSFMLQTRLKGNSETRLILAIAALFTLLQGITFVRIYVDTLQYELPYTIGELVKERLVALTIVVLYVILIVKTTNRFLVENMPWRKIIMTHLLFAVLISFLWYSTFMFVSHLLCQGENCDKREGNLLIWFLHNFDKLIVLYLLTVSITYTYYYVQQLAVHKIQKSHIETQLLQAKLQILKSQLQPHFLFNTLNSVATLMETDIRKARNMIADLSVLLRNVLDLKDIQIVPLEEELEMLEKYINIEKIRFADHLDIEMKVEEGLEMAMIPSMLLQPLVENSIAHGFSRKSEKMKISIAVLSNKHQLIVLIKNNGKVLYKTGLKHNMGKGTGLKNTYERLKSIYTDSFLFQIENQSSGVVNRIEIPLTFAEATLLVE